MDNSKLQQILAEKAQKDEQAKIEKQNADQAMLEKLEAEAFSYLPKIKEWIANGNQLLDFGIKLHSKLDASFRGGNNWDTAFCTDGVYHIFGFWYNSYHPAPIREMGIEMGGADGIRDIHTDGERYWVLVGNEKSYPMELGDYKELLRRFGDKHQNRIEQFEESFNAFLQTL